jgi:hypothetical protein
MAPREQGTEEPEAMDGGGRLTLGCEQPAPGLSRLCDMREM